MDMKKLAGEKAAAFVQDKMVIGLGTGSTAYWATQAIGKRVSEGLQIGAVATSVETETMARKLGIPMHSFSDVDSIDLTIDGADEVDPQFNLIKGGGGALMREKLVAFNSRQYIVVVDESKMVQQLGKFPLPVEVLPFGWELTLRQLKKICGGAELRKKDGQLFTTDNGNLIADLPCLAISDPQQLNEELHRIPGVLETGLFPHRMVKTVIVGTASGEVKILLADEKK